MRASNSALDAEDQDQEETPIPGAHNHSPARLFYRFSARPYTILFTLRRNAAELRSANCEG